MTQRWSNLLVWLATIVVRRRSSAGSCVGRATRSRSTTLVDMLVLRCRSPASTRCRRAGWSSSTRRPASSTSRRAPSACSRVRLLGADRRPRVGLPQAIACCRSSCSWSRRCRHRARPGDHAAAPGQAAGRAAHGDRRAHVRVHRPREHDLEPERQRTRCRRCSGAEGIHIGDVLLTWHRFITSWSRSCRDRAADPVVPHPARHRDARGRRQPRLAALGGARSSRAVELRVGPRLLARPRSPGSCSRPSRRHVDERSLTFLIITAFSAAVVGRLRSLPLTYLGALILALATQYVAIVPRVLRPVDERPARAARRSCCSSSCCCSRSAELQFARISAVRRIERVSTVRDTAIGMARAARRDRRCQRASCRTDEPQPLRARHVHRARRAVARAAHRLGRTGLARAARVRRDRRGRVRPRSAARHGQHLGGARSPRSSTVPVGALLAFPRCGSRASTSRSRRWRSRRWSSRCSTRSRSRRARRAGPCSACTSSASTSRPDRRSCSSSRSCSGSVASASSRSGAARSGAGWSRSATAKPRRSTVGVNMLETKLVVFSLSAGDGRLRGRVLRHALRDARTGPHVRDARRPARSCSPS